jgi:hypothetical protein
MEWLEALRGAVVGLDTAPLIYFVEENPTYLPFVRPFFEAVDRKSGDLCAHFDRGAGAPDASRR